MTLSDFATITLTRGPAVPLSGFDLPCIAYPSPPPTTGLPLGGRRWRARWRAAGRPSWRIRRAADKLRAGWTHEGVAEYRSGRQIAADFEGESAEYRAAVAVFRDGACAVAVAR